MPRFIVTSNDLVPSQTLIVPHVHELPNLTEIATGVRAIGVEVVLVNVLEALRWEGRQVSLAHDLLSDMVDAVT
jgi:hypothetical protein